MDKKIPILIIILVVIIFSFLFLRANVDRSKEKQLELIEEVTTRLELPDGLLRAIAKVESDFDSTAVSTKGAIGTMQIMPKTAKWTANKIGLDDFDLWDPVDNILLGGVILSDLLKKFRNNIHLALAAYHAGSGNVYKWMKRGKHLPGAEVIETFGFKSTKSYVKNVRKIWRKK